MKGVLGMEVPGRSETVFRTLRPRSTCGRGLDQEPLLSDCSVRDSS